MSIELHSRTGRSGSLGFCSGGGGGRRTVLGNVLEEEGSAARCDETESSSIPSEYATTTKAKALPPPNIGVFHIVAPDEDNSQGCYSMLSDDVRLPAARLCGLKRKNL